MVLRKIRIALGLTSNFFRLMDNKHASKIIVEHLANKMIAQLQSHGRISTNKKKLISHRNKK